MASIEHIPLSGVYAQITEAVKAAGSQVAFAALAGVSPSHLSDVLNARCDPGPTLLRKLGLVKRVIYVNSRISEKAAP